MLYQRILYLRLIIVWPSIPVIHSQSDHRHPQIIRLLTSSFPLFYIESNTLIRTLTECWSAVLATIIALDLHWIVILYCRIDIYIQLIIDDIDNGNSVLSISGFSLFLWFLCAFSVNLYDLV